jgi:hypothetical protein
MEQFKNRVKVCKNCKHSRVLTEWMECRNIKSMVLVARHDFHCKLWVPAPEEKAI